MMHRVTGATCLFSMQKNVDKGPIGKAMLDHRVPFGFHGNWRQMG